MKLSKEKIEQGAITAIVTLIVAAVGVAIFNIESALYAGITSGLSVTVGKEYGDSIIMEDSWHWKDAMPGMIGVIVGLLMCITLYLIVIL